MLADMLQNVRDKLDGAPPIARPARQGVSMEMSREQCRAARALLKMSQGELAEAAKVSKSTVVNFELGTRRNVTPENVQRIRIALEIAGVMFDGNGGVKLRKGRK
jgi:transcriptional regulator with XRE-family HTH domain